jgi:hypothetical protein
MRLKHWTFKGGFLAFAFAAGTSAAATWTVTTTNDSGPGSLRQAILDANITPGSNLIQFALPGTGLHTLAPLTTLPDITSSVTIDGYSQPGSKANTLVTGNNAALLVRLDGANLPSLSVLLKFNGARNCTVRGLILVRCATGIQLASSFNNTIAGNWIGIDADGVGRVDFSSGAGVDLSGIFGPTSGNLIGGATPADRNVIASSWMGVKISFHGASNNSIIGNYIGTDPSGTLPRGNGFSGIDIFNSTNLTIIGNLLAASKAAGGAGVNINGTTGGIIQSNAIGTDVSGEYDLGHVSHGINAVTATGLRISGNRICNNRGCGIQLQGGLGSIVEGNLIGTDTTYLRPMGNLQSGIYLNNSSSNRLGGTLPGAANVIRYNSDAGVKVSLGTNNLISANSIFDNGGLGILLAAGGNLSQSSPGLSGASTLYGSTQIQGSLSNQPPNSLVRLEFFASDTWDPLWTSEGQVYLGSSSVTTDAEGHTAFTATLPVSPDFGTLITATATDPAGNTSQFSASVPFSAGPANPGLRLARAGNVLTLSWPSTAGSFVLESTASLRPPINWGLLTNGISDDGSFKTLLISNSLAPTNQFYRLRK